jgi:hypothetical protein
METVTYLTAQQLREAADIKERIDALYEELSRVLGAPDLMPARAPGGRRRGKISAAGLANIRAAQKARWAALKKGKGAAKAAAKRKRKRKISAAGRARLAALARARWAKVKAAGRSRL